MTTTDGRPDGYSSLTPFLVCSPASEAVDFYCDVLGATVVMRMDGPDGTVPHAELAFSVGRLQLGDPSEEYGLAAPSAPAAAISSSTCVYVADVDAVSPAPSSGARRFASSRRPSSPATGSRRWSTRSATAGRS